MTQDEIIEMACQTFGGIIKQDERANFIAFAKLVAAKEKEAIIQIIKETLFDDCFQPDVIDAIRARGEQA